MAMMNELLVRGMLEDTMVAVVSEMIRTPRLNTQLGKAREKMQRTAEASADAWNVTQDEANKAFDDLRKSAAEVSAQLQKDLGINQA